MQMEFDIYIALEKIKFQNTFHFNSNSVWESECFLFNIKSTFLQAHDGENRVHIDVRSLTQ